MVEAAIVAFGYVYIHPFDDGNGRIHRFLIHDVLADRSFTPDGMLSPISATMVKNQSEYQRAINTFSKPLLELLDYDVSTYGEVTVHGEVDRHYRYMDLTAVTEYLFETIDTTTDVELARALDFLARFDAAKSEVQSIVGMPDRRIDLIIRLCRQNFWKLSKDKREKFFSELTDAEVLAIQAAVQDAFMSDREGGQPAKSPMEELV